MGGDLIFSKRGEKKAGSLLAQMLHAAPLAFREHPHAEAVLWGCQQDPAQQAAGCLQAQLVMFPLAVPQGWGPTATSPKPTCQTGYQPTRSPVLGICFVGCPEPRWAQRSFPAPEQGPPANPEAR